MKTVDIVLATYKPNIIYFEKLLESLNAQTYPKINLIVRDDSEDEEEYEKIQDLIKKSINAYDYQIFKNSKNIGSNKTFEILTKDSEADYIAYCDQDDIWEKEKITKLVDVLEKESSVIAYSDLSIIDSNDEFMAKSFKDIHKRLKHVQGDNVFGFLLRRNSVTGCSMLINSDVAKKAIPFCHEYFVHDHWLTLFASLQGRISYINEPLVRYRIHDNNQIGANILTDIIDKKSYYEKKILRELDKFNYLMDILFLNEKQLEELMKIRDWTNLRMIYFENPSISNFIEILKYINMDYQLTLFELFIGISPKYFVAKVLRTIKNN